MDGIVNKPGDERGASGQGAYIWLRYATQFTSAGRTHTVEMGIPMPIGASEETRARLLREAEAGMKQLTEHVEQRVARVLQGSPQSTVVTPTPQPAEIPKPVSRPAAVSAPLTTTQPSQVAAHRAKDNTPARSLSGNEVVVPPTRPHVGASMPSAPSLAQESSGHMTIRDFVSYIRENFGLNPNQAMSRLGLKSLSDVNLRAALMRLEAIMAQEAKSPDTSSAATTSSSDSIPAASVPPVSESGEQASRGTTYEDHPVLVFDEEVGPDEEEFGGEDLPDLDEADESDEVVLSHELTAQNLAQAKNKISRLRESRGATTASATRLQVLNTLISEQITQEQLKKIIDGVWGVTAPRRLKVDQLEELISWSKEDDFVSEVEAVLQVLEEERYARGNR
jgi:hypothetical protein